METEAIMRRMVTGAIVASLAIVPLWTGAHSVAADDTAPRQGVCQREARRLVGRQAVRISRKLRAPRKTRDVAPKYPEFPPGTMGSGIWMGEALIDTGGRIARVWTIREVRITPPLPAFNQAIVDAIRQWEFEPTTIGKESVPVCMTVTVNINWS